MVMARSSVHRRDDTLDLVQVVRKVDKIILVFTTKTQEICLLVLTTIVIRCTNIPGSYFRVKSKHVLKIKHGKYQVVNVVVHNWYPKH